MMQHDFNLNAHIHGKDGECGTLTGLVVNPGARLVTDIIVKRGYLLAPQRVIPIAMVHSAQEDVVNLSIGTAQVDQHPEYRIVEVEEPIAGLDQQQTAQGAAAYDLYGAAEPIVPTRRLKFHEGIPAGHKVIGSGMVLKNLDGKVGKVARVVVDRKHNEIIYLVAQRGLVFSEYLVIPITMVESISDDDIMLAGADEALENLPQYNDVVEIDA